MSVFWLAPGAWVGLTLVLVPILVHLLARQRSRRMPFPSLRFVPASQMAALRRRVITNWPLLIVRMLIVVAAIAAAAGPVFVSDARRSEWDRRVARAIVATSTSQATRALAADAAQDSFVTATFTQPRVADSVRAAAEWLRAQPPAARELVVVGPIPEGDLTRRDFDLLPGLVGIRFLPTDDEPATRSLQRIGIAEGVSRAATPYRLSVSAEDDQTRAVYRTDSSVEPPRVEIVTSNEDREMGDALHRAVMREGIATDPEFNRALQIVFAGGVPTAVGEAVPAHLPWARDVLVHIPEVRGELRGNVLLVQVPMRATDDRAPAIVDRVVRHAFAPAFANAEPRRLAAATLSAWSRPASGAPADVLPADEGDRRWFWGLALALLAVEAVMRRRVRHD